MSQPDWSDAYVLHRRPYRETSYIVDFFSLQTGKVSAVAKGVRSSKNERKSLLQPFRKVRIQLSGKTDLKNLRQIESDGPVPMLAGNDLFCAMYLNEILNRVMPAGLASDTVYAQYEHALNSLIVQPDIEKTLREFEFSLLEEMGMLADWFTDGLSGETIEPDGWYLYSPEQGFVACHQPGHKHRLPGTALIELGHGEWTALSRRAAKLINRQALHQLLGGKPLKSRELFRAQAVADAYFPESAGNFFATIFTLYCRGYLSMNDILLGVNIDHIATLRNARGTNYPDPVHAADVAGRAGADGITVHLREDRRHIKDRDVDLLAQTINTRLNLEMAVTDEMLQIALKTQPAFCCLVPEKREELTTEGGLDVAGNFDAVKNACTVLGEAGIQVSLFIDADEKQIDAAIECGAPYIEIHTGQYAEAKNEREQEVELARLKKGIHYAAKKGLKVNAGHGLHYHNVKPVAAIPEIIELNIGHAIIARAAFDGLAKAVADMRALMQEARAGKAG